MMYAVYRIGYWLAKILPLKASYFLASAIAYLCYLVFRRDRRAVINNIKVITGGECDEALVRMMASEVYANFAKYLVDFFRFSAVDKEYIKRFVKIDGLENVDEALANGKGVVVLSAHIGNWELGGLVLSLLRGPMAAVVLPHRNRRINDFFKRQRSFGNMASIEMGLWLRNCYKILKNNSLLAILGDRDFSKNGLYIDFFGQKALTPKGPAVFSQRIGSAIVPCFMIRQKDDSYRLIIERPIFPDEGKEGDGVRILMKRYLSVIESYVRRYPTQWYMFREVWNNHAESLRSDTIV